MFVGRRQVVPPGHFVAIQPFLRNRPWVLVSASMSRSAQARSTAAPQVPQPFGQISTRYRLSAFIEASQALASSSPMPRLSRQIAMNACSTAGAIVAASPQT